MSRHTPHSTLAILLICLLVVGVGLVSANGLPASQAITPLVEPSETLPPPPRTITIASASVQVGDIFELAVTDTESGGADLTIQFDDYKLQIVDAAGNPTTQVIIPSVPGQVVYANTVNNTTGQIHVDVSWPTGEPNKTIATLRFKALRERPSTLVRITGGKAYTDGLPIAWGSFDVVPGDVCISAAEATATPTLDPGSRQLYGSVVDTVGKGVPNARLDLAIKNGGTWQIIDDWYPVAGGSFSAAAPAVAGEYRMQIHPPSGYSVQSRSKPPSLSCDPDGTMYFELDASTEDIGPFDYVLVNDSATATPTPDAGERQLYGSVVDTVGEGVPNARLELALKNGSTWQIRKNWYPVTDGSFSVAIPAVVGEYRMQIHPPSGYSVQSRSLPPSLSCDPDGTMYFELDASTGDVGPFDYVLLQAQPKAATPTARPDVQQRLVHGTVVDEAGLPIEGAQLELRRRASIWIYQVSGVSGSDGAFRLWSNPIPGEYRLEITPPPGYVVASAEMPASLSVDEDGTLYFILDDSSDDVGPFEYVLALESDATPTPTPKPTLPAPPIHGYVWADGHRGHRRDGVRQPGEGLEGVHVALEGGPSPNSLNAIDSTVTNAEGYFAFEAEDGEYTIAIHDPRGRIPDAEQSVTADSIPEDPIDWSWWFVRLPMLIVSK